MKGKGRRDTVPAMPVPSKNPVAELREELELVKRRAFMAEARLTRVRDILQRLLLELGK